MERPGRREGARLIAAFRRDRAALLLTTALTACAVLLFALPARAQLAPDTQPGGGVVVAGSAHISANRTTTSVTQSSQRAAVNWQSFNVGSAATVNFIQPSSNAVTLNRVMTADPSQIAGHIHANGEIVLTNPAGVVFARGAEVNAASVVVSAAGISDRNFMAGRMVFDVPPKPGARIVNAGRITVKNAGLAALVAPEVVNSGVIAAKLGHVILAGGAAAETLDLYGDGLVSLDVTPEAQTVRLANGKKATALVTNTGTILATGGTVELTAREADGLVQDLVDAGGTIAANSTGTHRGTIVVSGIGGSIRVPGTLLAVGNAPGTAGGAIALDATGTVALPASARVNASGAQGGGTIAVGTTLARARGGPGTKATLTAAAVNVAPHAQIDASATDAGSGGRVVVLSRGSTAMAGTISARGGRRGGNGGSVEISGEGLSLSGSVDASAPLGLAGSILLDPHDLTIVSTGTNDGDLITSPSAGQPNLAYNSPDTTSDVTITPTAIEGLNGNVTLQATNNLEVASGFVLGAGQSLTLQAGNDLTIDPKVVVHAGGNIEMDAAWSGIPGHTATGGIIVQGKVSAGGNLTLNAGSGGIIITTAGANPPGSISGSAVSLTTTGAVNDASGSISATTLSGSSVGASLTGSNNVTALDSYDAGSSTFNLTNGSALTVTGSVQATGNLTIGAGPSLVVASGASLAVPGGSMDLTAGSSGIIISGRIDTGGTGAALLETNGLLTESSGSIVAGTLSGSAANGALDGANTIGTLGNFTVATGGFGLTDQEALAINGAVSAIGNTVSLTINNGGNLAEQSGGSITAGTLSGSATGVDLGGANAVDKLGPFVSGGDFSLTEAPHQTLAVTGEVSVPSGGTISLTADGITIGDTLLAGSSLAPEGTVILAPASPEPVVLPATGAAGSGTLSLNNTELGLIGASALQVGSANAQSITIKGAVSPPADIALLELISSGALSELTSADSISIGTLSGSAASVALDGANTVGTLGNFTATTGDFSLTDQEALAISGVVSAIGNTVSLAINDGGSLSESGGSITAGTLSGSAGSASLDGPNAIGTLGNFTVTTSGFSLTDQEALAINGAVSAIGNTVRLTINGAGNLTEQSGGSITAGTLSGSATGVDLGGANAVDTLGPFVSGGDFSLAEAPHQTLAVTGEVKVPSGGIIVLTTDGLEIQNIPLLSLSGSLNAPDGTVTLAPTTPGEPIALLSAGTGSVGTLAISTFNLIQAATLEIGSASAGPITIDGAVSLSAGTALLDLLSSGAISEGSIADNLTVATLAANVGTADLTGDNAIGALDNFTVTSGGLTLTDQRGLSVVGAVAAPSNSVDFTIRNDGSLSESGGSITAGTLSGSAGSTALGGANVIGTLGNFTVTTGGFSLADQEALAINGVVSAIGNTASLTINNGGNLTEQNGGSITAGTLSGSAASVDLGGDNAIADLSAFTARGGLSLTNERALAIAGPVDIGAAAATFVINGASLLETGAGVLTAGQIEGNAAGVFLPNSSNQIGTLGAFAAPGGLVLAVANGLAISGTVDAGAGAVDLMAGGSIAEVAGGTLIGGTLLGFAGSATLAGAAGAASFTNTNTLASLGNFTALGGFSLADTGDLALRGALDAGAVNVILTGGAAVTEPSGSITAASLSGTLSSASFGGTNRIDDLADFIAPGGFNLTDDVPLTLTGPVNAGSGTAQFAINGTLAESTEGVLTSGTLAGSAEKFDLANPANAISSLQAIDAPAGFAVATTTGLAIAGTVESAGAPIVLQAAGAISEIAGGSLIAGVLSGTASAASFSSQNSIAELGNFTAPGGFLLDNAGELPVAGLLDVGTGGAVLVAAGSLFETNGGAITAGTLSGSAASVALGSSANRIADLDTFSAGAFGLTDGESLTVSGPVTADAIGLVVSGDLTLGGSLGRGLLTSAGPISLTATGAISEPDGALDAASLSGSAASARLGGANLLPVLGVFTTEGAFLLNSEEPVLTVEGPVVAGSASLASTGNLVLAGPVSSDTATLSAGGSISEPSGVVATGTLAGTATSAMLTAGNTIATLGPFTTPGTLALTDLAPLAVAGPVAASFLGISDPAAITFDGSTDVGTLSVTSGGSITEPGGAVTAGLLEGSASGLVQLGPDAPAGSASVTTLGSFSVVGGSFSLTDRVDLTITGPLEASYFAITAPGSIALTNATITTLGLPVAQQSGSDPSRPGTFFDVTTPGGQFLELGRTTINPAGGQNTVRIQLNPAGGVIRFSDLIAPYTNLILDTGAGTAVGKINLGALVVLGNLGSADLTGTIAELSGIIASSKATISPFESPHYRLNACPLMSVNCVFIAPLAVPQGNPLSSLEILAAPPARNKLDFLLPNVAARDY